MAIYSGQSILGFSSKRKATARSLKTHLKDVSVEHGTDKCSYCNLAAQDLGLIVDPVREDAE